MKKFATKAIHEGQQPLFDAAGDVVTPIHLSTTFARKKTKIPTKGFEYSRSGNPTRKALETCLASLENAKHALAFSSGLAAEANVLMLLKTGDHVVLCADVYGGTFRLLDKVFANIGISYSIADPNEKEFENAFKDNTRVVWLETPTNPLLKIYDIQKISETAHGHASICVVDNTFASPFLQNPLLHGADIVLHSATKCLGGHSDVVGGCVMLNDEELFSRLKFLQNAVGAILSPFDSWLVLRGVKTLELRMQRHCVNAMKIALFLQSHPRISKVHYPGLPSHYNHELAKKQMRGFGGMVSFELNGSVEQAEKFLESLEIFALAESLGGVESLAEHPASMTHASIPRQDRLKQGLNDGLIRLSVGIEDCEDLIEDLKQALEKAFKAKRGV